MAKSPKGGSLHAAAVQLGARGGTKGGPARARKLTATERASIARKGGQASKKR